MIGQQLELTAPMRDRWLLSYADLLTLLLAFFVVMYSISKVDADRLKDISAGIVIAFNLEQEGAARSSDIMQLALPNVTISRGERDWIEFSVNSELLFSSGSATINTAPAVLENMLRILASTDGDIQVEGHTDNIPINTARFPSNWELSAARAAAVVRFVEARGIASNRLVAMGLGETLPLFDNDSNRGRAGNRRVVFKLREANIDFKAIKGLQLVQPNADKAASLYPEGAADETLDAVLTRQSSSRTVERNADLSQQGIDDFSLDQVDPALLQQVLDELEKENQ